MMKNTVNTDGLARLIRHELHRLAFEDKKSAHKNLNDRLGSYDASGIVINAEVNAFYGQMRG